MGVATQIAQVLALARAYHDREVAERRAARDAALVHAVLDSAPDFILHAATDGTVRLANRALQGKPAAAMVGQNVFELFSDDERASARATFETVVATGTPSGFEAQSLIGDRMKWFSIRMGPVVHDGRVEAVVIVARDITDNKQAEMQLMLADRMASVGTLAAGVAHEINNPLASVIANLDMSIQGIDELGKTSHVPAELVDELHDARTSADRVREIVRDLKIFSRAQEDVRGAVDVEKVMDSTVRMAWNELRHRARLVRDYQKVPRVDANESRLGQVFLNLLVNAVQAIPEGNYNQHEIHIATRVEDGKVVITLSDTGAGMNAEVQQRLFTPFFTTKPIGVGTGLGLAISHRIVTSLGGTITFVSEVGKGTEFRVVLPAADPALPTVTQTLAIAQCPARRRGKVLIIDDEEQLINALRRYLSQDHDVDAVTSGRAAIELIAGGNRYDVILCDVMMPQMTGLEAHDAIAKLDTAQAQRIVFLTGGAFTASARAFLDGSPNMKLEKPFDLKALRGVVNELVV
jgi:PAS domain S-box-containing protein